MPTTEVLRLFTMNSSIIKHLRYLILIAAAGVAAAQAPAPPAGKFYVIGRGRPRT